MVHPALYVMHFVVAAADIIFQIEYPEIEEATRPRHRFMSAYEQRVEAADKSFQYLLFAADPYETVSFKIPNAEVVAKDEGRFFTHWWVGGCPSRLMVWLKMLL